MKNNFRNTFFGTLCLAASTTLATAQTGNLLAVTRFDDLVRINVPNGAVTPIGPVGISDTLSLINVSGTYYTTNSFWLIQIDPTTGNGTITASITPGFVRLNSLAFNPTTGTCYGLDTFNPQQLHTIDLTTGATTLVGNTGSPNRNLQSLTISDTGAAYAWEAGQPALPGRGLMSIDLTTGQATDVNPLLGGAGRPAAFAFAGSTLIGAGSGLSHVDTTTAATRFLSNTPDLRGMAFTSPASVIPRGVGCPGTLITPILAPDVAPELGSTITFTAGPVAPNPSAILTIGLDGQQSPLGPIPVDLQPFGLGASCRLWSSADATVLIPVQTNPGPGAIASYPLAIPNDPAFAGVQLFVQAFSIDSGVPGGLAATRSLVVTIG
ncbi:MAG: hypothetical protein NXI31_12600 [bacterium]|nr:hypothetical protein [bacterium]